MEEQTLSNKHSQSKVVQMEVATLGGGCFWCTEAVFSLIKGVLKVESGYSGGDVVNPTYKEVSTGTTGHAEVVHITFNPTLISFRELLEIFFDTHDPTTPNRQGNDIGPQYRSVIFYHDEKQKLVAEKLIEELNHTKRFDEPIVTTLEPFTAFYGAEDYHREYFQRHPDQAYSRVIIAPKLVKLRKQFWDRLKNDA